MRPANHQSLTDSAEPSLFVLPRHALHSREAAEEANGLSITVVFTTVEAKLGALQRGGELAQQLGARIRILGPHVVPYPLPIDRPSVDPEFKIGRFRTVSVDGLMETRIDVRLCRDASNALMQGLCPRSVVPIGPTALVGYPRKATGENIKPCTASRYFCTAR